MKRKRLLAIALVFALALAVAAPALAADGDEATVPNGTTPVPTGGFASSGAATAQGTDGAALNVANDDDALDAAADNASEANIYVWAKVNDDSDRYKIDIAWGAMKFEFNSGAGVWNTTTHVYDNPGTAAWTVTDYLDGVNNKITVTNHSNRAIDATFAFGFTDATVFNTVQGANSVVGNFFEDNTKAANAALVLINTATGVQDKLTNDTITLDTADAYQIGENGTPVAKDARVDDVFFAFSGTPDQGRGTALPDFTHVGTITVTIAHNATQQASYHVP